MKVRSLQAALIYAQSFAFAVFPCHWIRWGLCSCGDTHCKSPGKHPLTEHGCKDATQVAAQIRAWWQRWPNANVAIATGSRSGIVVVDVDPRHGGDQAFADLQARYGRLPQAPTVRTGGGGVHIYLCANDRRLSNSVGALGSGIDVRGEGGYVIAPPSRHANSNLYSWDASGRIGQVSIAEVPTWLTDLLISPWQNGAASRPERPLHLRAAPLDFARLAAGIADGERDNQLFRLACSLRRRGYTRQQAAQVVLDAASRCHPPFPPALAEQKIASAWRYQ